MTRRGIILFLTLGVLWGIPYAFIKIAIGELSPEMLVLARTAIAAVALLPVAIWRREIVAALRHWKPLLAYTIAEIIFPWYFINAAEQRLSSSTVALLLAVVPLVGVGVAFLFGRAEPLTWGNWLGMAVGIAGVAALVGFDVGTGDLIGVAQMAVAVVGYAIGPAILAKYLPGAPGLGVVSLSLLISAVVYLPIVTTAGTFPSAWPSPATVGSVLVLALLCSGVAFIVMFALVAEVGPVRMTAITYINPAVAIIVGALLLGERVTPVTILGFALVLAGSYLVTRRTRPAPEPGLVATPGEPAPPLRT